MNILNTPESSTSAAFARVVTTAAVDLSPYYQEPIIPIAQEERKDEVSSNDITKNWSYG